MNFNFDRSIPVESIKRKPGGYYEIKLMLRLKTVTVRTSKVRFTTRSKLVRKRTSSVLADLGPSEQRISEVVIAAESKYRFQTFFNWCSNIPFPN